MLYRARKCALPLLFATSLLRLAAGCSATPLETACTLDLPRAIDIQLRDSLTGQLLHAPASITAMGRETGQSPFVTSALPSDTIVGGINGFAGTYDVVTGYGGYVAKATTISVPSLSGPPCNRPARQFVRVLLRPSGS